MIFIIGVLVVCAILGFLLTRKKPEIRPQPSKAHVQGKQGEQIVQQHYCDHFCQKSTVLLNDCTFVIHDGHTTQIDHILVSPFGVFVIETKNYQGWIFGSERQKQWTVCLGSKKFQFQNPLHQNYLHLKTLVELFESEVEEQHFHSVVVFVGKSEFKTDMPANVCQGEHWVHHIKNFKKPILSAQQVQSIVKKLEANALKKGFETDCQHIENLKKRHAA
ncbi:nuclease-related domain-containing protein [Acinetobacter sp. HY1485]|uniref:nuclease-related domain-containing protein n=1 Tax=Acinetobacter sp. HY1485 TaxID=2970918 RepID=UPI0022B9C660|nr:nuclease-related domain-containing protein [Acinetobacter sp. HY1485]